MGEAVDSLSMRVHLEEGREGEEVEIYCMREVGVNFDCKMVVVGAGLDYKLVAFMNPFLPFLLVEEVKIGCKVEEAGVGYKEVGYLVQFLF
jgi:hypothetical protein